MYDLHDKVAVITGAGRKSGIGAAIAMRLAQEGAHVVVADLCAHPPADVPNSGAGQWQELQHVAQLAAAAGVQTLPVRADVTDAAAVGKMVAETMSTFGRLDILVNNAGAVLGPAPVVQLTETAWRKTLEINVTGTFLCCRAALPAMIQGGRGGRIINMSSLAAIRPKPYLSAYAASKAAIIALTQALAQEVATFGITVNAVLPGDINTAFKRWGLTLESQVLGQPYEEVVQRTVAQIPLGRLGLPEDVANLVAFLASEQASFITGQGYNLTGGRELTAVVLPKAVSPARKE